MFTRVGQFEGYARGLLRFSTLASGTSPVFFSQLALNVTLGQLLEEFESHGKIHSFQCERNPINNMKSGKITYETHEDAEHCLTNFDYSKFVGVDLILSCSIGTSRKRFMIVDHSQNFTEQNIRNLFSSYGNFRKLVFISDRMDRYLGYIYVEFDVLSQYSKFFTSKTIKFPGEKVEIINFSSNLFTDYMKNPLHFVIDRLPTDMTIQQFGRFLRQFGNVHNVEQTQRRYFKRNTPFLYKIFFADRLSTIVAYNVLRSLPYFKLCTVNVESLI